MKRILLFLLLMHVCFIYAQTNVSGTLTSDTIWNKEGSPYNLTSTLGVFDGAILTIEPGVVVTGDFDLLVKGVIKLEGESNDKIIFRNTRLIFKDTNLGNSILNYVDFQNDSGLQLADEGEHNQDPIKNSGTLLVKNSTFNNGTYARTKGYSTTAKLRLFNCQIIDATIKGYYPRSEEIEMEECFIKGGVINSDSYNDGIFLNKTIVEGTNFRIGCCGANFNIEASDIKDSNFEDYNNYYRVSINNTLVRNTLFNLPSGELEISNSLLVSPNQLDGYLVRSRNVNLSNVIFNGKGSGSAVKILNKDFTSSIQNCTFSNFDAAIVLNSSYNYTGPKNNNKDENQSKKNSFNFTFKNNNLLNIQDHNLVNNFNSNIDATSNYWGTIDESVISNKIIDGLDDINFGIVDFSGFLTAATSNAPIATPQNVFKGATDSGVTLMWDEVNNSDLNGYRIYYKSNPSDEFILLENVGKVNSFSTDQISINSIISLKSYSINADGVNDYLEGNESDYSEEAQNIISDINLNSNNICYGDNIELSFKSNYSYSDNEFVLQISDTNGSFDSPMELARISDANEGFSIPIPADLEKNKTYLIRILTTENNFQGEELEVVFNEEINSQFELSNSASCEDEMITVEYVGSLSDDMDFIWDFKGATIVSGSNAGPFELLWNQQGEKEITLEVVSNGCSSKSMQIVTIEGKPSADFSVNEFVCEGANASITYNGVVSNDAVFNWNFDGAEIVSGTGSGPYEITWNDNYGEKNISLTVTDNGCTSDEIIKKVQHNPYPNVGIEANEQVCLGDKTTITYTGDELNNANYNWNFNGGTVISGSGSGPYEIQWYSEGVKNISLEVIQNGCAVIVEKEITVSQTPTSYFYLSNYNICNNGTTTVYYYGSGDDSSNYNWDFDGAEVISGTGRGPYEITWNDNYGEKNITLSVSNNNCTSQTTTQKVQFNQSPTLSFNAESSVCKGELYTIEFTGDNFTDIYWSFDGAEIVSGSGAGPYELRWNSSGVKNINVAAYNKGCYSGDVINVEVKESIETPEICVVTVDEESLKNKIVWDYYSENLSQFAIYKETVVAGSYELLSYVGADTNSFIDENSSPAQSSSLYKISAIDKCGGETDLGAYHKTIHLVLTPGIGNSWNMIWNDYEGFEFYTYRIHRSIDGGDYELLTEVSSNLNSYTDLNVSSPNVAYYIEVISSNPCGNETNERKGTFNSVSSKSNVATTSTTLSVNEFLLKELKIGPNPTTSKLYIKSNSLDLEKYNLYSIHGQLVKSNKTIVEDNIDLSKLARGTYILKLKTNKGTLVKKVIKK
ncbi:Por_Secre_tail domain-containing protein [Tenacibaculum sp. 190524A05c]|uniref:T9SS type A sorting domain-containing protein n=1 Tax=Tenacibaculum platacis TaxID=3137852 RepID=UPI0031FACDBD